MREAVLPTPTVTDRWSAWDRFLEATPSTGFMQSSWWADFRTTVGFDHFAAILKDPHGVVGGALVQKYSCSPEYGFYYMQDGPALPDDEAVAGAVFEAILENIQARRKTESQTIGHLRIEPRWPRRPDFVSRFQPPPIKDSFTEPRNTLCVDLRLSEPELLAQMKPKGRYNIRVAQKHGVSVVEDLSEQGLEDFLSIYEDTADRQEFGAKPEDYFQALISVLSDHGRGSIFFAEHQGTRLAAALVVYFGRRATYFYGGSLDTHRNVMAPYLLHFEMMRRAKALGHEWYDLWGIAPEDKPDHPWAKISVFKRKFGGVEVNLVPTLDYVFEPAAYAEYLAEQRNQQGS